MNESPLELNRLYLMDCMKGMAQLPDSSIDMVLCDLPYGITQCSWDIVIPFGGLWEQYKRISKPNCPILLFSVQPFTTDLINSNRKMFRYEIIWEKTQALGFLNAKKMPLRAHENILVFYKKLPIYNPIKTHVGAKNIGRVHGGKNGKYYEQYIGRVRRETENSGAVHYNDFKNPNWEYVEDGTRYPTDVIKFSNWNGAGWNNTKNKTVHPTQKPLPLFEYLIKTYTNKNDIVLDNCMGSGTTAIAAIKCGRQWIGFENNPDYYQAAMARLESVRAQISLFGLADVV